MKVSFVLGTRPEIIKMSPIIRECEKTNTDFHIIHTGQHYSYTMDKIFFEDLELPEPKYNLEAGSGTHGEQTGKIMINLEPVLIKEKPDIVLVQGDTNTVLAGSLVASKLHLKVGHVEAGLRSFDRRMPEEINRILADHVSDYLFAPTQVSKQNLLNEGIPENKIHVTGNTILDAVHQNMALSNKKSSILNKLGLSENNYFLVTLHRAENVDDESRLRNIFEGLSLIHEKWGYSIVFPVHPRTRKMIDIYGISLDKLQIVEPMSFLDFLQAEANACLVLTDSGGVQEECCILGVPCVTLRDSTERPETIFVKSNVLAGVSPESIYSSVNVMHDCDRKWINPFGDGNAGKKIMKIICGE